MDYGAEPGSTSVIDPDLVVLLTTVGGVLISAGTPDYWDRDRVEVDTEALSDLLKVASIIGFTAEI